MDTLTAPPISEQLRLAALDLYRDVHKGIRAELFALTASAGSLDPGDAFGWTALAAHVAAVDALLSAHAAHEDTHIDSVLAAHAPALAASIVADHVRLERQFEGVVASVTAGSSSGADRRLDAHRVYLRLASFTSAYLAHQAVEELEAMPLLEDAIGVDAVAAIHLAIVGSIPMAEMVRFLTLMLPAMNIDDRSELLAGMAATAPADAFSGVVSLAGSVLTPGDFEALAARIGLAA